MKVKVAQSCLTLCDPLDYTAHEILQARILEWVAFPFSRGIFPTQGSNPGLPYFSQILYQLSHKGSQRMLSVQFSRSVMSNSLRPHEGQHARPPCPCNQLPEFTQTHVHRVSDAIQPSYPLSSPSPPAFNLSQHQGLF